MVLVPTPRRWFFFSQLSIDSAEIFVMFEKFFGCRVLKTR